jgi:hypothetical protein
MMSIVSVLACAVAVFFAPPFLFRLHDLLGTPLFALLSTGLALGGAWLGHTPETYAAAEDFRSALRDVGMSQKEAAIEMGIPEPTLANWLSGKEQAGLWRMVLLGPAFEVAYYKRRLTRTSDVAVIDRGLLADLVGSVQALVAEQRRPRVNVSPQAEVA